MDCKTLIQYLSAYIDNELDEELAAEARDHLATCRNCHVVLDSTQKTILLYRARGDKQRIPAERGAALYGRLAQAFTARHTEDDCTD